MPKSPETMELRVLRLIDHHRKGLMSSPHYPAAIVQMVKKGAQFVSLLHLLGSGIDRVKFEEAAKVVLGVYTLLEDEDRPPSALRR